jgi:glycosyltransferase involved in cell wall biosynthesis
LNIIGDADIDLQYTRKIKQLIERFRLEKKIRFAGRVSETELNAYYSESHVLAVPSYYEGFGIVYLEAMSFGVVPLASETGGASEIISSGEDGYLISAGNSSMLSDCIKRLITDRETLLRMSRASYDKYSKFPGWDESGKKIREFILSIFSKV